jgi:succinoglycan biosynthesis transport protein ExoP
MSGPLLDWMPDLLAFLRRSWRVVTGCTVVVVVLAAAYLLLATPSYTASSTLMLDVQAAAPFQRDAGGGGDAAYVGGVAESQVEILESMGIARAVVRKLGLGRDWAFLANGQTLGDTLINLLLAPFSRSTPSTPESRAAYEETHAATVLAKLTTVRRIGMSFILQLDVTTHDPAMSTRLNAAIVDAFVDSGLDAKIVNTKRASVWLHERIAELQGQAAAADRAVQDYKAQAGIVDTDRGLMNEQHLGELNSQLVLARTRLTDATARLDRIRDVMAHDVTKGQVSDELENAIITHLREEYVDDARQLAEWLPKFGPNHASVVQMRARLKDIQQQIQTELERIAQSTESDYEVALANERDIERQLAALVSDADATNVKLVRLRELQSAADNYKSLYADFLQRYTEAVQDQSFPISNVRVVTQPFIPTGASWPRPIIVLPASLVLGLFLGFAVALVRESLDRGLHTAAQVRAGLGLPCLGLLPVLKLRKPSRRERAASGRLAADRQIVAPPPILRQIMLAPLSPYAEAIRGLRLRLARASEGRRAISVIGCVSALPGEGKTTVSANFAFFLAAAGFRTLLVDWDLRRRSLSRLLAPTCAAGFAEVVNGSVPLDAAIWHDPDSSLAFLPAGDDRGAASGGQAPGQTAGQAHGQTQCHAHGAAAILPGLGSLLASLREQYDYVVVDLPALLPAHDAAAAARLVDGVVIVVEWAKTPIDVVRDSLEQAGIEPQRLLGVVLNKVDVRAHSLYSAGSQAHGPVPLVPA